MLVKNDVGNQLQNILLYGKYGLVTKLATAKFNYILFIAICDALL